MQTSGKLKVEHSVFTEHTFCYLAYPVPVLIEFSVPGALPHTLLGLLEFYPFVHPQVKWLFLRNNFLTIPDHPSLFSTVLEKPEMIG